MALAGLARVLRRLDNTHTTYTASAFGLVAFFVFAARALGFSYVSDDDFCRITIAQQFAAHPRLDPTGTSWLPVPFWLLGAWLMAFGRSLASAELAAPFLAMVGLVPYLVALRRKPLEALVAVALALAVDWSAWLSATPVPEAFVAPIVAAPFVADDLEDRDNVGLYAAFLVLATLARYEAWPLALVAAGLWVVRRRSRALVPAALATTGIALWLAWNAHAHGSALHFAARVSRYAAAHGALGASRLDALALYPRALVDDGRAMVPVLVVGFFAAPRRDDVSSVGAPRLAALALVTFLTVGAARGGMPTHHPVRALMPLLWLAAPGAAARLLCRASALPALALAMIVLALGRWSSPPGHGTDDRSRALAIGHDAKARGARRLTIASCGFEHFATMAAFGDPDAVTVVPRAEGGPCPELLAAEPAFAPPELR